MVITFIAIVIVTIRLRKMSIYWIFSTNRGLHMHNFIELIENCSNRQYRDKYYQSISLGRDRHTEVR